MFMRIAAWAWIPPCTTAAGGTPCEGSWCAGDECHHGKYKERPHRSLLMGTTDRCTRSLRFRCHRQGRNLPRR